MTTTMSPDEIAHLLEAIQKLDCAQVEVTAGDVRIVVRRDAAGGPLPAISAPAVEPVKAPAAPVPAAALSSAAPAAAPPAQPGAAPASAIATWLEREAQGTARVLRAPMIGTFYRAKAPGEPPFVEVGAPVRPGDTVGLVEAMKLFNSLLAECEGTVSEIFVANGELVEYEQPVMAVRT